MKNLKIVLVSSLVAFSSVSFAGKTSILLAFPKEVVVAPKVPKLMKAFSEGLVVSLGEGRQLLVIARGLSADGEIAEKILVRLEGIDREAEAVLETAVRKLNMYGSVERIVAPDGAATFEIMGDVNPLRRNRGLQFPLGTIELEKIISEVKAAFRSSTLGSSGL